MEYKKFDIEKELFLLCIRSRVDDEIQERIWGIINKKNIDWEYLINLSLSHEVFPLLYRTLISLHVKQDVVPHTFISSLKMNYLKNAINNILRTEELIKLLEIFKKNNISAIPYKGPILASCVYGNLAMRQFCDLDIIIEKRHLFNACGILSEVGYLRDFQLSDRQVFHLFKEGKEIHFHRERKEIIINLDIHWELLDRYYRISYPFESLWNNRCSHTLKHFEVPIVCLCPEDLFIAVCLHHGVHESWLKLKQICDLSALINTYQQMDWDKIMKKIEALRVEPVVWVGLNLVKNLFDTKLPPIIIKRISGDTYVNSISIKLFARILNDDNSEKKSSFFNKIFPFYIYTKKDFLSRLLFWFYKIIKPNVNDIAMISLPTYFYFVYYFIRPFRLIKKILRRFIR